MLNNFILQTPRLRIQNLDEANEHHIFELYSKAHNKEFLHGVDAAQDIKLAKECYQNFNGIGCHLIFENHSNNFVGFAGIQKQEPMIDGTFAMEGEIEFLIIFDQEFNGRGFGSEFCAAFFENFFTLFPNQTIQGRVNKDNIACLKLLEKSGFVLIGETHYHTYDNKFAWLKIDFDSWSKKANLSFKKTNKLSS